MEVSYLATLIIERHYHVFAAGLSRCRRAAVAAAAPRPLSRLRRWLAGYAFNITPIFSASLIAFAAFTGQIFFSFHYAFSDRIDTR